MIGRGTPTRDPDAVEDFTRCRDRHARLAAEQRVTQGFDRVGSEVGQGGHDRGAATGIPQAAQHSHKVLRLLPRDQRFGAGADFLGDGWQRAALRQ